MTIAHFRFQQLDYVLDIYTNDRLVARLGLDPSSDNLRLNICKVKFRTGTLGQVTPSCTHRFKAKKRGGVERFHPPNICSSNLLRQSHLDRFFHLTEPTGVKVARLILQQLRIEPAHGVQAHLCHPCTAICNAQ